MLDTERTLKTLKTLGPNVSHVFLVIIELSAKYTTHDFKESVQHKLATCGKALELGIVLDGKLYMIGRMGAFSVAVLL